MSYKKETDSIWGLTDPQSKYIRNLQESCLLKEWDDSIKKFRRYNDNFLDKKISKEAL